MYITAMWLRSPRQERGVNVYVHWHPDGLPQDRWQIANNPGPDARELRRIGIRPGGNGVEAYVDIVLEDDDYNLEMVVNALRRMARHVDVSTTNLVTLEFPEQNPHVLARFWINNVMADRETKRDVYGLLRRPIEGLLQERIQLLPDITLRRQASNVGGLFPGGHGPRIGRNIRAWLQLAIWRPFSLASAA